MQRLRKDLQLTTIELEHKYFFLDLEKNNKFEFENKFGKKIQKKKHIFTITIPRPTCLTPQVKKLGKKKSQELLAWLAGWKEGRKDSYK